MAKVVRHSELSYACAYIFSASAPSAAKCFQMEVVEAFVAVAAGAAKPATYAFEVSHSGISAHIYHNEVSEGLGSLLNLQHVPNSDPNK